MYNNDGVDHHSYEMVKTESLSTCAPNLQGTAPQAMLAKTTAVCAAGPQ